MEDKNNRIVNKRLEKDRNSAPKQEKARETARQADFWTVDKLISMSRNFK